MESNLPHRRLPVVEVLKAALLVPWENLSRLFTALWITAVLLAGIDVVSDNWLVNFGFVPQMVLLIVYGAISTLFAITCHRIVLLGPDSVPKHGVLQWSKREWRFFGWGFVAYFYMTVISALIVALLSIVAAETHIGGAWWKWFFLVAWLPGMYVFSRLCVLLPATAVDERRDMRWAWDVTRGNGWRLVAVVGILPVLLWVAPGLLMGRFLVLDILLTLLGMVLLVVEISALSFSFRYLFGHAPLATETAAVEEAG